MDLPAEIIDEILSRLPVKPLCRFRCVSKPWQSRISDPNFIAMHSSKAIDNKDVLSQRVKLVFTAGKVGSGIGRYYSLDLNQLLILNHNVDVEGFTPTITKLDFVSPNSSAFSVCNSFLYLQGIRINYGFYLITNPATRETKKVRKPPALYFPYDYSASGIGFDHSTSQYKLVNAQYTLRAQGRRLAFRFYTLKAATSNSWRQVEGVYPYTIDDVGAPGILLNGCVHWLGRRVDVHERPYVIISVDLEKEEVKEIASPPIHRPYIELGLFRNQLCVTYVGFISRSISIEYNEFWVMKKYGVRDSWTKMLVSKPYKELSHSGFSTKSHDLMVFNKSSFVMYNFNDGTFWNLNIGRVLGKRDRLGDVRVYVESLASLAEQE